MNLIILLLPIIAIVLMFRSQKKRQQQMQKMQTALEPGAGVRTIGGLYAQVKAVNDETVELEIAPGVVAYFTKSAIAAVLDPAEYDAIINGRPVDDELSEASDEDAEIEPADEKPLSLSKDGAEKAEAEGGAPASK
ncbi:preprotein translocase subunit YajC [Streptomyces sp. BE20]|uniref:preprotein translocase subunit YajC n=1 Tax=Streptomycetaceae TaxID=2062 RepID=UPI002E76C890|nr:MULTISPECIES: preprotein translocase subunit YajC [unclassified Streptomyces]MED7950880.1 preprotein translocase subunit YajC [Streptomyces sp. BE303]MEE1826071.1 preprotein translocase subunit YajC [Streptomyces sp. BE20]